ncbi:hypothetical protein BC828DRAFT_380941 [Blastocladiella britannica]|nr:hypothetical protein BC828DRAFT_380941 [Blastocladiella britannica]
MPSCFLVELGGAPRHRHDSRALALPRASAGLVLFLFAVWSKHFSHWSTAGVEVLSPTGPTVVSLPQIGGSGTAIEDCSAAPTTVDRADDARFGGTQLVPTGVVCCVFSLFFPFGNISRSPSNQKSVRFAEVHHLR